MKFIDSHCHLDFDPLSKEVEKILIRAQDGGVEKIINIGSSLASSKKSIELAGAYPNVWATVGIHPHDAYSDLRVKESVESLLGFSGKDKVVGIGEIGLDYYSFSNQSLVADSQKNKQKELFNAQLEVAIEKKLPAVFHVRDAWSDFFEIIEDWKTKIGSCPKGVLHCFTGDENLAKRAVEMGFYLGFSGFITFEQEKFSHIRRAVLVTPIEKILIETDAPFLAPEPYRGKTNEPLFVKEVARKISDLKNLSIEDVAKKTYKNTERLFGI